MLAGVTGIGPATFAALLRRWGGAREVLAAARTRALRDASGERDDADAPVRPLAPAVVMELEEAGRDPGPRLDRVRRAGLAVVTLDDADYPGRLRAIELPPPVLFIAGDPGALAGARAAAVVGTRRPTPLGRTTAEGIARELVAVGAVVVSGLAVGIDGVAHAAALAAAGRSVAVIGGGHDRVHPAVHRPLASALAARGGAVVSEFPPAVEPSRSTFPRRNRILSGLADATIVVEAGRRSGALITAAWALEQGRGCHLVPGRPGDPAVAGSLAFLREAGPEARIVADHETLVEDLGWERPPGPGSSPTGSGGLAGTERVVADALVTGAVTIDDLVAATGLATAVVLGTLTLLEVRGLVVEALGRYRPSGALVAPHGPARLGVRSAPPAGR